MKLPEIKFVCGSNGLICEVFNIAEAEGMEAVRNSLIEFVVSLGYSYPVLIKPIGLAMLKTKVPLGVYLASRLEEIARGLNEDRENQPAIDGFSGSYGTGDE